jgi:PST family polysaccharide transporter
MSFVATFLINTVELDIRTQIANKIAIEEAGYWTALTFVSKNYMVFITGILSLYVLPKFAAIKDKIAFRKEVSYVFKSILPLFAVGMVLIYLFRNLIIDLIYPNFTGMAPLFKWQLLGDFFRLMALILSYQFLAKSMVKSFVLTELISLALFYILSTSLLNVYGTEGVVMAHFIRYVLYFLIVFILAWFFYKADTDSGTPIKKA